MAMSLLMRRPIALGSPTIHMYPAEYKYLAADQSPASIVRVRIVKRNKSPPAPRLVPSPSVTKIPTCALNRRELQYVTLSRRFNQSSQSGRCGVTILLYGSGDGRSGRRRIASLPATRSYKSASRKTAIYSRYGMLNISLVSCVKLAHAMVRRF